MRKKNCFCGRSLTKCVAQSTPVVTTSLWPPLKVRCTSGVVRLLSPAKFAHRSIWRRNGDHGQWICVAGTCAVLLRFNEHLHWRQQHSSDLRQWGTARATTVVSSGVRRRHFSCGAFVVLSALYRFTVFVQHIDHSFPVTQSTMTRKTTALYQGVFEKMRVLILQ